MLLKSRVLGVISAGRGDFSYDETSKGSLLALGLSVFAGDRTISSCRKGDRIEYEDFKHSVGRPQNAGVLPMILFDSTRLPLTPWLATDIFSSDEFHVTKHFAIHLEQKVQMDTQSAWNSGESKKVSL